ncbi:MAG: hypothetical protein V4469_02860 [Patescibacteria group bacterium]
MSIRTKKCIGALFLNIASLLLAMATLRVLVPADGLPGPLGLWPTLGGIVVVMGALGFFNTFGIEALGLFPCDMAQNQIPETTE